MGSFNLFQYLKKNRYKKVRKNVGIGSIDYLFIWSCLISVKSGEIIMDSKYTIVISIFVQTHILHPYAKTGFTILSKRS